MTSVKFIGAIDLSVRLSSMNPLGYLDLSGSTTAFERSVLQALEAVWQRTRSDDLLDRGIVKGGDVPKGFEFDEVKDLVAFVTNLRWKLLEERLPFKICVRLGVGVGQTLEGRWRPLVNALRAGGSQLDLLSHEVEEAKRKLGTADPDVMERYFRLHLPLASTDNTADLHSDLEGFKGLGFHADPSFREVLPEAIAPFFFTNYFPARVGKTLQPRGFVDMLWQFSPHDLIRRYAGADPNDDDDLATGSAAIVANLLEMMRRSLKADETNGMYYVSLLNGFVASSSFSRLMYISSQSTKPGRPDGFILADIMAGKPIALQIDEDDPETQFAIGWQNYPPIFRAVMLEESVVRLLKKSPGSEIVLGTLLDRVRNREVDMNHLRRADPEPAIETEAADVASNEEVDVVFDRLVREVERRYGEAMLRKVFNLPEAIVCTNTKKEALRAATVK